MRSLVAVALAGLTLASLSLGACAPKLPKGVDDAKLTEAVGRAIGGPNTCVEIADDKGQRVWRGGGYIGCARPLPACDGTTTTADAALKTAVGKPAHFASCPSGSDVPGATVGWAMGPVPTGEGQPDRRLTYVAMMEGDRALPGVEIQDRVEHAFKKAGL